MSSPKQKVIEYRLQCAREALDDAGFNLSAGRLKVAANRIYYAMFYATVALLATRNLSSHRHSGVTALLHEHFVKTGVFSRDLAHQLGRSFEMRTNTDYKVVPPPDPDQLREMFENARVFVQKTEELIRAMPEA